MGRFACVPRARPLRVGLLQERLDERTWRVGSYTDDPAWDTAMALRRAAKLTAAGACFGFLVVSDGSCSVTARWRGQDLCDIGPNMTIRMITADEVRLVPREITVYPPAAVESVQWTQLAGPPRQL